MRKWMRCLKVTTEGKNNTSVEWSSISFPSFLLFFTWGTIIALVFIFFSCARYQPYRYKYVDKPSLEGMKKLYLLGLEIKDTSSDKDNPVVFYSASFIKNSFLPSFIDNFNKQDKLGLALIEWDKEMEREQLIDSFLKYNINLDEYRGGLLPRNINSHWIIEYGKNLNIDGFMVLEFETSVWRQEAVGFFKVYDKSGKVIWREEIKDFSSYIVIDKKSPYLNKNQRMLISPSQDSYYQQLKKVYQILGKILSKEFTKTLKLL